MPILTRCRGCRALIPQTETRCPNCTGNTSWNGARDRSIQRTFRKLVLYNAGYRCQWVDETTGHRCIETSHLQAHHTRPGNDDPRTGLALCGTHHHALDPHATP